MNKKKPKNSNLTAKQRLEHFEKALKPINYESDNDNDNTKHGFHKSTGSKNEGNLEYQSCLAELLGNFLIKSCFFS